MCSVYSSHLNGPKIDIKSLSKQKYYPKGKNPHYIEAMKCAGHVWTNWYNSLSGCNKWMHFMYGHSVCVIITSCVYFTSHVNCLLNLSHPVIMELHKDVKHEWTLVTESVHPIYCHYKLKNECIKGLSI